MEKGTEQVGLAHFFALLLEKSAPSITCKRNPPQIAYALIALFMVLYLSLPQHLWEDGLATNLQKAYTHNHLDDGKALAIFYPRCLQVAVRPQLTRLSAPSSSSYLPCVDFQHTGYLLLLFHCN